MKTIHEYSYTYKGISFIEKIDQWEVNRFRPYVLANGELCAEWDIKSSLEEAESCLDEFNPDDED
jgi:hypothetical protein